jgi:hypothetical protein
MQQIAKVVYLRRIVAWREGQLNGYRLWLEILNRPGDPILAGNVLHAAGT